MTEPSSSVKRTKRASSMPLLSLGETGKDDALAHGELGGEAQFVVGVGEPVDALQRAAQVAA